MALPLSGLKDRDLLSVTTKDFHLTIKGKPIHPTANELMLNRTEDGQWIGVTLDIIPAKVSAKVFDPSADTEDHLKDYRPGNTHFPCFYENQTYQLIIINHSGKTLVFHHENKALRSAVSRIGNTNVWSGNLNFKNDVGFSELEILGDGKPLLKIRLEVFPAKLDYRRDYQALVREVNEEIYNLAFDFLKKTFFTANLRPSTNQSLSEFFSIITLIFDNLLKALERIDRNPHHRLTRTTQVLPSEKIKRVDHHSLKWLEKNTHVLVPTPAGRGLNLGHNHYQPQKLQESKKILVYDTFENRFTKWVLHKITQRLKVFRREYEQDCKDPDQVLINRLTRMERQLQRVKKYDFLQEAGNLHQVNNISLVLQMAPGYREVYKYFLMLMKGLSIQSDVFRISQKDIATLYEYWCFLKLNAILKKKYRLTKTSLIKTTSRGLTINLEKTRAAGLHYLNPANGEKMELTFNTIFTKQPTIAQKPDTVLTLEKENSQTRYRYIFDAKYRLNPAVDKDYRRKHSQPGPEENDINTMHRYRDAIVLQSKTDGNYQRTIFGAYILFPHNNEEAYAGLDGSSPHNFYTSIDTINIGGLPFLPSQTKLVEKFLDQLILDSPDSAFERTVPQEGTDKYFAQEFQNQNVLVGSLRNRNQLAKNLEHNFYHIPYWKIRKHLLKLQYIAIYQPKKFFGQGDCGVRYYGKIKNGYVVPRHKITEVPKTDNELYVKFEIEEWLTLKEPIKPAGYGVLDFILTTAYLLQIAKQVPELSLQNEGEIRLWKELRRLDRQLALKYPHEELRVGDVVKQISLPGLVVRRTGEETFTVTGDKGEVTFSLAVFRSQPKRVFNELVRIRVLDGTP
ncbi:MAG: DUF2357 domain-containing protein [Thermincolia bacterium]